MSSEDATDFAALISQYEATEHDMLNNLDAASAADSSAAKSHEVPLPLLTARRNAPSMSDSDESEDDDDDDESHIGNDDTSYTAEDANEAEEDSETSYTEGNDDGEASESEDDSSEESEWESDDAATHQIIPNIQMS